MTTLLWTILAAVVGLAAIGVAARIVTPAPPPLPPGTDFPPTALQRASRWSLLIGGTLAAGAGAVLVAFGPQAVFEVDPLRLAFTALVLLVLISVGGGVAWLKRRADVDEGLLDERDRTILDRAPAVQGLGVVVVVAAWSVGLVEYFHSAGAVPTYYVTLLFWSCLVAYILALPLGVLLGYRRR